MKIAVTINDVIRSRSEYIKSLYASIEKNDQLIIFKNDNFISQLVFAPQTSEEIDGVITVISEQEQRNEFYTENLLALQAFAPMLIEGNPNRLILQPHVTLLDIANQPNEIYGTYLFCTRHKITPNNLKFVTDFKSEIKNYDIFITTDVSLLSTIPEKCVKIRTEYNMNIKGNFIEEIDSFIESKFY